MFTKEELEDIITLFGKLSNSVLKTELFQKLSEITELTSRKKISEADATLRSFNGFIERQVATEETTIKDSFKLGRVYEFFRTVIQRNIHHK